MLLAFCKLRNDYRQFHVTQICAATTLDESFRPRRVQLLNAYVAALRLRVKGFDKDLTLFAG